MELGENTLRAMLNNPHDKGLPASKVPAVAQWAGIAAFAVLCIFATLWALTDHWRRATFTLGSAMLWLSALRLTCDSRVLGILSVRSRRFDALFTASIGAIMMFLSASVDALGS